MNYMLENKKSSIDTIISEALSLFKEMKEQKGLDYRTSRAKIEAYGRICRGMIELVSIEEKSNYRDVIHEKVGNIVNDPDNRLFASYFIF